MFNHTNLELIHLMKHQIINIQGMLEQVEDNGGNVSNHFICNKPNNFFNYPMINPCTICGGL